jgi:hypothetical protein
MKAAGRSVARSAVKKRNVTQWDLSKAPVSTCLQDKYDEFLVCYLQSHPYFVVLLGEWGRGAELAIAMLQHAGRQ